MTWKVTIICALPIGIDRFEVQEFPRIANTISGRNVVFQLPTGGSMVFAIDAIRTMEIRPVPGALD